MDRTLNEVADGPAGSAAAYVETLAHLDVTVDAVDRGVDRVQITATKGSRDIVRAYAAAKAHRLDTELSRDWQAGVSRLVVRGFGRRVPAPVQAERVAVLVRIFSGAQS